MSNRKIEWREKEKDRKMKSRQDREGKIISSKKTQLMKNWNNNSWQEKDEENNKRKNSPK